MFIFVEGATSWQHHLLGSILIFNSFLRSLLPICKLMETEKHNSCRSSTGRIPCMPKLDQNKKSCFCVLDRGTYNVYFTLQLRTLLQNILLCFHFLKMRSSMVYFQRHSLWTSSSKNRFRLPPFSNWFSTYFYSDKY